MKQQTENPVLELVSLDLLGVWSNEDFERWPDWIKEIFDNDIGKLHAIEEFRFVTKSEIAGKRYFKLDDCVLELALKGDKHINTKIGDYQKLEVVAFLLDKLLEETEIIQSQLLEKLVNLYFSLEKLSNENKVEDLVVEDGLLIPYLMESDNNPNSMGVADIFLSISKAYQKNGNDPYVQGWLIENALIALVQSHQPYHRYQEVVLHLESLPKELLVYGAVASYYQKLGLIENSIILFEQLTKLNFTDYPFYINALLESENNKYLSKVEELLKEFEENIPTIAEQEHRIEAYGELILASVKYNLRVAGDANYYLPLIDEILTDGKVSPDLYAELLFYFFILNENEGNVDSVKSNLLESVEGMNKRTFSTNQELLKVRIYLHLSQHLAQEEDREYLQLAKTIVDKYCPPHHHLKLKLLMQYATYLNINHDFEESIPLLDEIKTLTKEAYGEQSIAFANVLHQEGVVKAMLMDYYRAHLIFKRALKIYENVYGNMKPHFREVIDVKQKAIISMAQVSELKYSDCQGLLKECLELREEIKEMPYHFTDEALDKQEFTENLLEAFIYTAKLIDEKEIDIPIFEVRETYKAVENQRHLLRNPEIPFTEILDQIFDYAEAEAETEITVEMINVVLANL